MFSVSENILFGTIFGVSIIMLLCLLLAFIIGLYMYFTGIKKQ